MATATQAASPAARFLEQHKRMLIDGEWVEADHGQTLEVYDPALGEVIDHVPAGDAEDVDRAVVAARRAFEDSDWSRMTVSERGRVIWRIGDLILEHVDELAEIESLDNGKPVGVARAADVPLAADLFHYMAGFATKIHGQTFPVSVPYAPGAQFHAYTLKEPIGVVGQIIPWNFPLLMAAWKLGPALATGCTVVLKPAEQTPLSALRLAELMQEAGLPNGVLNVITGFGETAGAAIAAHPGVDKVAFTGSTEVGKLIVKAAANDLKRVTIELGGKSPNVVFADADLETAIPGAANAIFFNHGQCCCAGSRLYIEQKVYDDVLAGVSDHADHIKVGRGLDPDTEMGPLVSVEQLERVTGFLEAGEREGVRTVTGGKQVGEHGYFVAPTVLDGAGPGNKVFDEEIFGPVVTAIPFKDTTEVAAAANDTIYGLAAGVWTNNLTKAHRLIPQLKAGTVWVNTYNIFDAALPFGGYNSPAGDARWAKKSSTSTPRPNRCASGYNRSYRSPSLRAAPPGAAQASRTSGSLRHSGPRRDMNPPNVNTETQPLAGERLERRLEELMHQDRFSLPVSFVAAAHVNDASLHARAELDPDAF